jgi:alanine dehydrogenase
LTSFEIKTSTNLEQTVCGAGVVMTLTPARGPIVMADWISPGTHIAAVRADKKVDQELESRLLMDAHIFVDDIHQCRIDGEINVPLSEGLITEGDIAGEIGEVVTGKKHGRTAQGRHVTYAGQFVSVFVSPAGAVDCIEDDGLLGT